MVNTHVGECAIHLEGGRDIVFRPTFLRVAQLGSPKEILDVFTAAQIPDEKGFEAAYRALYCFADEGEIDDVIGYFEPKIDDKGRFSCNYVEGLSPLQDLHVIGCKLLQDAIIGRPTESDKRKSKQERAAKDFDPAEFVAIGVALIGGSNDSWWQSTMIQLQKALKAKNPDKEDEKATDKESQKELFATLDRMKKEKAAKNG